MTQTRAHHEAPRAKGVTVKTRGLSRVYDDDYALVDLNATFPSGSITALLGPNGAGKSTLIGMLSTLLRPSEGTVLLGELDVTRATAAARGRIGYVGHATMVYSELTAEENLVFFAKIYGLGDVSARICDLLDEVGLSRDKDRPVSGFSRGMTQRLTLARALLPRPALLLLDEPFTGLDQAGVVMAISLFKGVRDAGAAVILASHDLAAVGRLADRALVLRRGRKVFEGPIEGDLSALYQRVVGGAST